MMGNSGSLVAIPENDFNILGIIFAITTMNTIQTKAVVFDFGQSLREFQNVFV